MNKKLFVQSFFPKEGEDVLCTAQWVSLCSWRSPAFCSHVQFCWQFAVDAGILH